MAITGNISASNQFITAEIIAPDSFLDIRSGEFDVDGITEFTPAQQTIGTVAVTFDGTTQYSGILTPQSVTIAVSSASIAAKYFLAVVAQEQANQRNGSPDSKALFNIAISGTIFAAAGGTTENYIYTFINAIITEAPPIYTITDQELQFLNFTFTSGNTNFDRF